LGPVVAPLAAHPGRLHRWAVEDGRARLRVAADLHAQALPPRRVDPLPGAVEAPGPPVTGDRAPRRQVVGQQARRRQHGSRRRWRSTTPAGDASPGAPLAWEPGRAAQGSSTPRRTNRWRTLVFP